METLRKISKLFTFFASFNLGSKANSKNQDNLELTYTKFGLNSKQDSNTSKSSNSLLSQLYSEENEALFI